MQSSRALARTAILKPTRSWRPTRSSRTSHHGLARTNRTPVYRLSGNRAAWRPGRHTWPWRWGGSLTRRRPCLRQLGHQIRTWRNHWAGHRLAGQGRPRTSASGWPGGMWRTGRSHLRRTHPLRRRTWTGRLGSGTRRWSTGRRSHRPGRSRHQATWHSARSLRTSGFWPRLLRQLSPLGCHSGWERLPRAGKHLPGP